MKQVTIEQWTEVVTDMSITHTQDHGFVIAHFGSGPTGEKVLAISHMDGACYLMTGHA
jgi:hypothetical protein